MDPLDQPLEQIFPSQWHVFILVGGLLIGLAELGFRTGRRFGTKDDGQIGAIEGAVLGLLGLLLAFTFSMAVQRYDLRRNLLVEETNAIRTSFDHASFLPEPHQTKVKQLLRRYVDVRIAFYDAGQDEQAIADAERSTATIQQQLWAQTTASAQPPAATFVNALSETFDLDTKRLAALRNHVPALAWLLLLFVAGCGCWTCGYGTGSAAGKRSGLSQLLLPLLIAVVGTILVDFGVPRRGLIEPSQQSLIELKESLTERAPTTP